MDNECKYNIILHSLIFINELNCGIHSIIRGRVKFTSINRHCSNIFVRSYTFILLSLTFYLQCASQPETLSEKPSPSSSTSRSEPTSPCWAWAHPKEQSPPYGYWIIALPMRGYKRTIADKLPQVLIIVIVTRHKGNLWWRYYKAKLLAMPDVSNSKTHQVFKRRKRLDQILDKFFLVWQRILHIIYSGLWLNDRLISEEKSARSI